MAARLDLSRRDQYWSQRNNVRSPMSACTPTSVVMALDIEGLTLPGVPDGTQPEDYLMHQLQGPRGDELLRQLAPWFVGRVPAYMVHKVVAAAVNSMFGRPVTVWEPEASLSEVAQEILARHPVVISGQFAGYGHTVCVAGVAIAGTEPTEFMLMDPFGNPLTDYQDHRGNDIWVERDWLQQRWSGHMHRYRKGGLA